MPKNYLLLCMIVAMTAGLLFGFDSGNLTGALIFIESEMQASRLQCQILVSIAVLFGGLAALASGGWVDRLGRKMMLIIAALLYTLGALLSYWVTSIEGLMIARALLGAAMGISSYAAPLYLSEVSPVSIRGTLVLMHGAGITLGEAIAFFLDYQFAGSGNWRMMLLSGAFPGALLLIGMLLLPCSPRWLMTRSTMRETLRVLMQLRTGQVRQEARAIRQIVNQKWRKPALFAAQYRKPLFIGLGLGIGQQMMGMNILMYYGPYVFGQVGFNDPAQQIFLTFLLGATNAIVTVIALLGVEKLGRRFLLLVGTGLATLSMLTSALLLIYSIMTPGLITVFCILMFCFVIGYSLSVGSIFWLLLSEIFPLKIRARAMSFVGGIQWFSNFLISASFLSMMETFGLGTVFSYCVLAGIFCHQFTRKMVPETKGKTLENLESSWHSPFKNMSK